MLSCDPLHSRSLIFMTLRKITTFLMLSSVLAAQAASAADTGRIEGQAKPKEQLVIINQKTGSMSGVVADNAGHYEADKLSPGQYLVVYEGLPRRTSGAPVIAGRTTVVKDAGESQAGH